MPTTRSGPDSANGITQRRLGTVVSFPKSGRTWLRVMLDELGLSMAYDHDSSAHLEARHFSAMAPAQPHILQQRIVLLTRDPRDTAVSGYFQVARRLAGYPGDMGAFIRDPHHGVEKIVRFNLAWAEPAGRLPTIVPVTYEQLQKDTAGLVRLVAGFLSEIRSEAEITRAVEACTFERMQQKERTGEYSKRYGAVFAPPNPIDVDSFKVRRGKVGGYNDHLNEQDLEFCEEIFRRHRYFERMAAMEAACKARTTLPIK